MFIIAKLVDSFFTAMNEEKRDFVFKTVTPAFVCVIFLFNTCLLSFVIKHLRSGYKVKRVRDYYSIFPCLHQWQKSGFFSVTGRLDKSQQLVHSLYPCHNNVTLFFKKALYRFVWTHCEKITLRF